MHDLNKLFEETKAELASIGIIVPKETTISVSKRLTRSFGNCTSYSNRPDKIIHISDRVMDDSVPLKSVKEIIIHEELHAVAPYKCHHNGEWLRMMHEVNDKLGYNVSVYGNTEKLGIKRDTKHNAILKCVKCGREFEKCTRATIVHYPYTYQCSCGGKIRIVSLPKNYLMCVSSPSRKNYFYDDYMKTMRQDALSVYRDIQDKVK